MNTLKSHDVLSENWHRAWSQWTPKAKQDLRRADKAFKAGYMAALKDMNQTLEAIASQNQDASESKFEPLAVIKP